MSAPSIFHYPRNPVGDLREDPFMLSRDYVGPLAFGDWLACGTIGPTMSEGETHFITNNQSAINCRWCLAIMRATLTD